MVGAARKIASFVKLEHTVFSLPLLFAGAWLASPGWPGWEVLALIVAAGAGARTAALALNRIIDREIDRLNPRTKGRELPSGRMTLSQAVGVAAAGALLYVAAALWLGGLCAWLWPLPLLVFITYPYLKRWTAWCHLGVGLGLACGPLGGALAADPSSLPGWRVWLLSLFTVAWVCGFDIIYATLDEQADRRHGIHSAVVSLGRKGALKLSAALHVVAFLCLAPLVRLGGQNVLGIAMLVLVAVLLTIEHLPGVDPEKAFFDCNALVGFAVFGAVVGS